MHPDAELDNTLGVTGEQKWVKGTILLEKIGKKRNIIWLDVAKSLEQNREAEGPALSVLYFCIRATSKKWESKLGKTSWSFTSFYLLKYSEIHAQMHPKSSLRPSLTLKMFLAKCWGSKLILSDTGKNIEACT